MYLKLKTKQQQYQVQQVANIIQRFSTTHTVHKQEFKVKVVVNRMMRQWQICNNAVVMVLYKMVFKAAVFDWLKVKDKDKDIDKYMHIVI